MYKWQQIKALWTGGMGIKSLANSDILTNLSQTVSLENTSREKNSLCPGFSVHSGKIDKMR